MKIIYIIAIVATYITLESEAYHDITSDPSIDTLAYDADFLSFLEESDEIEGVDDEISNFLEVEDGQEEEIGEEGDLVEDDEVSFLQEVDIEEELSSSFVDGNDNVIEVGLNDELATLDGGEETADPSDEVGGDVTAVESGDVLGNGTNLNVGHYAPHVKLRQNYTHLPKLEFNEYYGGNTAVLNNDWSGVATTSFIILGILLIIAILVKLFYIEQFYKLKQDVTKRLSNFGADIEKRFSDLFHKDEEQNKSLLSV